MVKDVVHNLEMKGDTLLMTLAFPVRIGLLPDIHAGETRAVCVPEFKFQDQGGMWQTWKANEAQLMLHELWKRNIEMFRKYHVQHIFVIGDAFGGTNYREEGAFIFLKPQDQVRLAADLLQEMWEGLDKTVDFYIWRGTAYHEDKAGRREMHEELVEVLRARGIPAKFMYQASYVTLRGGKSVYTDEERVRRLFIAHEAPTGLVYPATLMSRDINWCLESEASGTTLPVDAIIRGHCHHWLHVDHSGIHALLLPCWLGHTPYKSTVKYFFKLQPTLGGAMMLMDEYGRLQFWGGSYPFGFSREERTKFHELCVTVAEVTPEERIDIAGTKYRITGEKCTFCGSSNVRSYNKQEWKCYDCKKRFRKHNSDGTPVK